jgi:hypothetical protein
MPQRIEAHDGEAAELLLSHIGAAYKLLCYSLSQRQEKQFL